MIGSMFGLVIIIASSKTSIRLIVLRFPLCHILPLGSRLLLLLKLLLRNKVMGRLKLMLLKLLLLLLILLLLLMLLLLLVSKAIHGQTRSFMVSKVIMSIELIVGV